MKRRVECDQPAAKVEAAFRQSDLADTARERIVAPLAPRLLTAHQGNVLATAGAVRSRLIAQDVPLVANHGPRSDVLAVLEAELLGDLADHLFLDGRYRIVGG